MAEPSFKTPDGLTGASFCALVLVAAHLVIVAAGALHVQPPRGLMRRAVAEYGVLSGADADFQFFVRAPEGAIRPRFDVYDRAGRVATFGLGDPRNVEADLRVASVASLWDAADDDDARRALLAAWVAWMFRRHPEADHIVARVETYPLPSMAAYAAGARPEWREVVRASFRRTAGP